MARRKNVVKSKKASDKELFDMGVYKGYEIKWLRGIPEHPDYHLVAEYDKKVKSNSKT